MSVSRHRKLHDLSRARLDRARWFYARMIAPAFLRDGGADGEMLQRCADRAHERGLWKWHASPYGRAFALLRKIARIMGADWGGRWHGWLVQHGWVLRPSWSQGRPKHGPYIVRQHEIKTKETA